MLPILFGVAAAALLIGGCHRKEESDSAPASSSAAGTRTLPVPPSPDEAVSPRLLPGLPQQSPFRRTPSLAGERCRPEAPRPERFAIHDPRGEFCRLHELLRGAACRVEGGEARISEERTMPSIFALFPDLSDRSDFGAVARDPELRAKLAALEGLQTYLYSGRPCELDHLGDLMDLMEAYTLYQAALNSPQAPLRRAFREGRAGCILLRAVHRDEGVHTHEVNGLTVHHHESQHDGIVTPSTVALENLPSDIPVSDCLVVR